MAIPLTSLLPPDTAGNAPTATLPPAPSSVAILGRLPASTPVHLALGSVAAATDAGDADSVAVILARSGSEWVSALLSDGKGADGDAWFAAEGGKSGVIRRASRIVIKYVPTLAHLSLFLSLLHCETDPSAGAVSHPARLEQRPSVIILHELSSFFVNWETTQSEDEPLGAPLSEEHKWTIKPSETMSSLALPLSLALTAVSNLNTSLAKNGLPPTQLVLLDSLAGDMTLPILAVRDDGRKGPDLSARTMVERLFDWTAVVEQDDDDTSYAVERVRRVALPQVPPEDARPAVHKVSFRENLDESTDRRRASDEGRGVYRWL